MLEGYWTIESGEPVFRHHGCNGEIWYLEDKEVCIKCGEESDDFE